MKKVILLGILCIFQFSVVHANPTQVQWQLDCGAATGLGPSKGTIWSNGYIIFINAKVGNYISLNAICRGANSCTGFANGSNVITQGVNLMLDSTGRPRGFNYGIHNFTCR